MSRPAHPRQGPAPAAQCASIAGLVARARELDALDQRLRTALASPLAGQFRLADVRDSRAVVLASSPAAAARVRMAQAEILSALRACGVRAETLAVRVGDSPAHPAAPAPLRKPLSRATAAHLRAAAASMSDPQLRSLFLDLASFAGLENPKRDT